MFFSESMLERLGPLRAAFEPIIKNALEQYRPAHREVPVQEQAAALTRLAEFVGSGGGLMHEITAHIEGKPMLVLAVLAK